MHGRIDVLCMCVCTYVSSRTTVGSQIDNAKYVYERRSPSVSKHWRKRKSPNLTKSTVSLKLMATREIVQDGDKD